MSTEAPSVPRLLYRGDLPAKVSDPDTIETKAVQTADELAAAQKDGWRLTRDPKAGSKSAAKPDSHDDDAPKGKK